MKPIAHHRSTNTTLPAQAAGKQAHWPALKVLPSWRARVCAWMGEGVVRAGAALARGEERITERFRVPPGGG